MGGNIPFLLFLVFLRSKSKWHWLLCQLSLCHFIASQLRFTFILPILFFFFLYPLAPGWGFSTEGAREALQSMTVAASYCSERGSPHCLGHQGDFRSLASENTVSSISQTLTSGKFPGSPRRLTCSWFCTRSSFSAAVSTAAGPFHMACCCSLARGPAPAAAAWPGGRLLTVLHFNNWAVVASFFAIIWNSILFWPISLVQSLVAVNESFYISHVLRPCFVLQCDFSLLKKRHG